MDETVFSARLIRFPPKIRPGSIKNKIIPKAAFVRNLATRYDYIPDPYYEGAEGFELVLDLLQDACANLYSAIEGS